MEFSSVTQTAFFSATILSAIFAITTAIRVHKANIHWLFPVAAFVQTGWLLAVACYEELWAPNLNSLLLAETLHYVSWLLALTATTYRFRTSGFPRAYSISIITVCVAGLALYPISLFFHFSEPLIHQLILWQGIMLPLAGLLTVEQLYRNATHYRLIKLLCINLAVIFIFDAYLFSQEILLHEDNSDLWQIRAAVSMATCMLMTIGLFSLDQPAAQPAQITISRPIAFYTASLTITGALLTILIIGGYYVRLYGGNWGTVLYTVILVLGLLVIAFVFSSKQTRENLNVLINKHLFSHKYDYRTEWVKLINQLSQPIPSTEIHSRAIRIVANVFKCSGGALWLKRGKVLVPTCQVKMNLDISETFEPDSSAFCSVLQKEEWVFALDSPSATLKQHNELVPEWARNIENIWLILPLLNETSLVGFMVLTSPQSSSVLTWEDLDLLKTVGRQVASYLERHEQSELLAESRQFDAFNKLAAYVMHDLKNLIAQQSLVVKNAEKHKDNPAFVEDAINTINNSVIRMSNLLRKLQHNEPESVKTLVLKDILVEAVKQCRKYLPAPTLMSVDESIRVNADPESLTMVFTHIIQNAQDATPNDGFIDISAHDEGRMVTIYIEDNGEGMDESFIQHRLFKPFETTKTGKGMGIGVYQAKEYAQSLGGNISVESSPGEGTTFIITLPTI